MKNNDAALIRRISDLRQRKKAIILAHNYQLPEVQDIADFVGDSLELSQKAATTDAAVIVFCGVHFMAETASILCPDRIVLLPDINAGCPMANMITAAHLRKKKEELPDVPVICYINSSAEVKAESDVCCTSANAAQMVNSVDSSTVIFVPDKYLGLYVSTKTEKEIILWQGYCPTHARILPEHIIARKKEFPQAKVVVHPECPPGVIALADAVLSTSGIIRYAHETEAPQVIVGTETGIIHRLKKDSPAKQFIPASDQAICPDMKRITLGKIWQSLEDMSPQVTVPEAIRIKAKAAVDRMLSTGKRN